MDKYVRWDLYKGNFFVTWSLLEAQLIIAKMATPTNEMLPSHPPFHPPII